MSTTSPAWMSAEEFASEQHRLKRLIARRHRNLSEAEIEDVVAEALLVSWRRSAEPDGQVTNRRRWLNTLALNSATARIERDKHAQVTSFTAGFDEQTGATVSGGREPLLDDFTLAEVARRERFAARTRLVAGLRRIRRQDVELFLDRYEARLSHTEIAARRGVTRARVRKSIKAVARFLATASGLVESDHLDADQAVALAAYYAKVATPRQRGIAREILARADGPELYAAITEAMRRGVYLPALLGSQEPARDLDPLGKVEGVPAVWQRIGDAIAAGRHQLVGWATTGKDSATATAAQYLPAGTGVRPGAAIGAALALCLGGATVCVDQGVIPNPLGAQAKPPADQAVKAPKPLRARRPTKTAPAATTRAAAPTSQTVRLRAPAPPAPERSTSPPASSPASTAGGAGSSNEFGGPTSEFGGGTVPKAAGGGSGGEFGGGGSSGGGSSGSGGGGGEFGVP